MSNVAFGEAHSSLREYLQTVLTRYDDARRNTAFAGLHEISIAFRELKALVEQSQPVGSRANLSVVASYGKGNWATIPWLSILDDRETTTTQRGIYVVYLFSEGGDGVYLTVAQGITEFESFNRVKAKEMLQQRANSARLTIAGLEQEGFDLSGQIDLRSKHHKARMYEQSTIASKYYAVNDLPSDEQLLADLDHALEAYETLVKARVSSPSQRKIALLGTWTTIRKEIEDVRRAVQKDGAWASPWSFKLKEDARAKLDGGFTLFINGGSGTVVARAHVSEFACSDNYEGMHSPWPEITGEDRQFMRLNDSIHGGFKTWLKIESIDMIDPIRAEDFEVVDGLSTSKNVVNQNAFGYVYERDVSVIEVTDMHTSENSDVEEIDAGLTVDWLAEQTLLSPELLGEMVETLHGPQPQIILAGPPGTSKTWVAQRLARFVTRGRKDAVRLVQFHPSYTYESFIEGLRPKAGPTGVSFEVAAGVVLQTVQRMRDAGHLNDARYPYVIIIDEANRANLPRVMGELLYLLEYRNESISLQLTKDFQLPTNLLFIATMNTADRSIRSIDAAMRRRFEIFDLPPSSAVLERFHAVQGSASDGRELALGLDKLNQQLTESLDRHHTIGHSFFMRSDMSAKVLNEVWSRKLLPLIEEYYFDQPETTRKMTARDFWPGYVD